MDLEEEARIVEQRANQALLSAHPRESIHEVVRDIVRGWDYLESTALGGPRRICITTRAE